MRKEDRRKAREKEKKGRGENKRSQTKYVVHSIGFQTFLYKHLKLP